MGAIGQPADRDRDEAIEEGEIEPADQPELAIGDLQRILDRLGENAEQLPVEEVEYIDEGERDEHDPAAVAGGLCFHASLPPAVSSAVAGIMRARRVRCQHTLSRV
jgi:hypothetical protein